MSWRRNCDNVHEPNNYRMEEKVIQIPLSSKDPNLEAQGLYLIINKDHPLITKSPLKQISCELTSLSQLYGVHTYSMYIP